MKKALLLALLATCAINAQHFMQSEEAKRMEADYQKNKTTGFGWQRYWKEVKSNAQELSSKVATNPSEKKSYEIIARCARFLETHLNYFMDRDNVKHMTEGIDEKELDTVSEKKLDHPLCQKIERECGNDRICREKLNGSASAVQGKEYTYKKATWQSWGYGWLPRPGYYNAEKQLVETDPLLKDMYQTTDVDTLPDPDMVKKGQAILACQKCYEHDVFIHQLKKEYDERFLGKANS